MQKNVFIQQKTCLYTFEKNGGVGKSRVERNVRLTNGVRGK